MQELTIIKYTDGKRLALYGYKYPEDRGIDMITHATVDSKEVEELQQATYEQTQKILEKYI